MRKIFRKTNTFYPLIRTKHEFPPQIGGNSEDCIWKIVKVMSLPESSENDFKIDVCVLMGRLDTLT